ncbi:class II fructose-bisphosphate aldolase [Enterococcus hulanensis]|uniref:Class II fructose-bisphosphate aldolase n=1 Tax=Enterococcus hulanensis TaxID=2559929 RepID=A0ABU3F0B2_9ENTE|nr:class II fructose-bisphosphate aldolase [Enterococcus hulanensis]MDT2600575.1 class II fructose-bisphosphate aldolase [Enterococcus hulanensis]MDT2609687.1 class II fructose-bisphosphate aldolase [Enterococcus hulanensis]MDT2617685.1 class II fructose-bisphosphate aldolase [Enterococcus hulanensis]MDT2628910.1 class II fructose-bisphosphate aldolase [Enterococcus hulanensis]MDT2656250.1 class II fructose-bisphosphate aldolase [Enterococcus hulanensis]
MLVTLNELLKDAKEKKYAVGAFNVPNLEAIRAVIQAAEELGSPVILQHAEVHENLISLEEIGPIMLQYAKAAKVPVAVHLDHGASFEMCVKAIRLGFTSVMYDASSKEYEVNMAESKEIVKIAHAVGVSVEAELGHIFTSAVGGGEGRGSDSSEDYEDLEDVYTDPDLAKAFVEETGVDCLAIGFGTVHGIYLKEPKLDLNRILQIKEKIDVPFVMHGGSGVSEENYRTAIKNGICKINYYTYMNKAAGKVLQEELENFSGDSVFFDELSLSAIEAMKNNVKAAMEIFMNP